MSTAFSWGLKYEPLSNRTTFSRRVKYEVLIREQHSQRGIIKQKSLFKACKRFYQKHSILKGPEVEAFIKEPHLFMGPEVGVIFKQNSFLFKVCKIQSTALLRHLRYEILSESIAISRPLKYASLSRAQPSPSA